MAYELVYSGGKLIIDDASINTQTTLSFTGKNLARYGSFVNQNFLSLLENFSSSSSSEVSSKAVQGQLWYDVVANRLKYNTSNIIGTPTWREALTSGVGQDISVRNITMADATGTINGVLTTRSITTGSPSTTGTLTGQWVLPVGSSLSGNIVATFPTATTSTLGGVIVGSGLSITGSGLLSATPIPLPTASTTTLGGVIVGSGLAIEGGVLRTIGTGLGSVTSVSLIMPSGFSVSGSPVTTSGSLTVTTNLSGIIAGTGTGFTTVTLGPGLNYANGVLSATGGGGGGGSTPPGGTTGQVQYNNGGNFGGISGVTSTGSSITFAGVSNISIGGGAGGQVLSTNGSGVLSWISQTGGGGGGGGGTSNDDIISIFDYLSASQIAAVRARTNTTEDLTTAFNTAIGVLNNRGGGVLYLPAGQYVVRNVILQSNIKICGAGINKTIIRGLTPPSGQASFWFPTDQFRGNMEFRDFTVDSTGYNSGHFFYLSSFTSNIIFDGIEIKNHSAGNFAIGCYTKVKVEYVIIRNCLFRNNADGNVIVATETIAARGSRAVQYIGNVNLDCGRNLCQVRDYEPPGLTSAQRPGTWEGGLVANNIIMNVVVRQPPLPPGFVNGYAFEWWGFNVVEYFNNYIEGGEVPLTGGGPNYNVFIANNIIKNCRYYAFEASGLGVNITDNILIGCGSLLIDTGADNYNSVHSDRVVIARNLIANSYFQNTNPIPDQPARTIDIGNIPGSLAPFSSLTIKDNIFYDLEYIAQVIRIQAQQSWPILELESQPSNAIPPSIESYRLAVDTVWVVERGNRYAVAPTVVFVRNDSNVGTEATGTATIDAQTGFVTGITVTNPGSNYRIPPTIYLRSASGDNGVGARAIALMKVTNVTFILLGSTGSGSGMTGPTVNFRLRNFGAMDVDSPGTAPSGPGVARGTFQVYTTSDPNTGQVAGVNIPGTETITQGGRGYGRSSEVLIEGNTYYARTYQSCLSYMSVSGGTTVIKDNRFYRTAKYDNSQDGGGSTLAVMTLDPPKFSGNAIPPYNSTLWNGSKFVVEDNIIDMTCENSGGITGMLFRPFSGANNFIPTLKVRNNKFRGSFNGLPAMQIVSNTNSFTPTGGFNILPIFENNSVDEVFMGTSPDSALINSNAGSIVVSDYQRIFRLTGNGQNLSAFNCRQNTLSIMTVLGGNSPKNIKIIRDVKPYNKITTLIANIRYASSIGNTTVGANLTLFYGSNDSISSAPAVVINPTLSGSFSLVNPPTVTHAVVSGYPTTTISPPAGTNTDMLIQIDFTIGTVGTPNDLIRTFKAIDWSEWSLSVGIV